MIALHIALPVHWYRLLSLFYKGMEKGDFMTLLVDRGFSYREAQYVYQTHIAEYNWYVRYLWWKYLTKGIITRTNNFGKHCLEPKYNPVPGHVFTYKPTRKEHLRTWVFYTYRKYLYRMLRWAYAHHLPGVEMEDDDRQQVTSYTCTWLRWTAYDLYDF